MDGLRTIFENEFIYIISKDHGIPCQSKDQQDIGQIYNIPHFVTRLDQPASGLLLMAKTPNAAAIFSAHLKRGRIQKQYVALVEGTNILEAATLSDKISKKGQKAVIDDSPSAKEGVLEYKVNAKLDRFTMLDIKIHAGRFHQIRSQLSEAGMPIKGDLKYGAKRSNKEGGIYLCCTAISIPVDQSGIPKVFKILPSEYSLPLWKFYKQTEVII